MRHRRHSQCTQACVWSGSLGILGSHVIYVQGVEQQASTRAKTDVRRGNRQPPAAMTIRSDQRSSSGIQQGYNAAARDDCRRRALSGRQSDKQAYEDAPSTRPIKPDKGSSAGYKEVTKKNASKSKQQQGGEERSDIAQLALILQQSMQANKLPAPEPGVFTGDVTKF